MMDKNNDFSTPNPSQLLRNPQVQKLLTHLQSMDPELLRQAASLASSGHTAEAQQLLTPILQDDEVQKLTNEMRDRHGRS